MPSFPEPRPREEGPPSRAVASGPPPEFPETRWSIVLAAGRDDAGAALERLAELTWRPACAYLRALGHGHEEARDLTQAFFVWVLESGWLARARPERGSFRGFLKRSLKHFALDVRRRESARKRGGGRRFVPLEPDANGQDLAHEHASDPEAALDAAWRQAFLSEALGRLEQELAGAARALEWSLFSARYLEDGAPDRRALAARFAISETDVKNRLARTRARLKRHLREALVQTVERDDELAQELAWLFEGGP